MRRAEAEALEQWLSEVQLGDLVVYEGQALPVHSGPTDYDGFAFVTLRGGESFVGLPL